MAKLNQVIALDKGVKNQCNVDITAAYHDIQKTEPFKGIARTYQPRDEDGEKLPAEHKRVVKRAEELLSFTAEKMTRYWDVTLTKDAANCSALADVIVDGNTVLAQAPVTFLLFLEKQLVDFITMAKKLPTLDAGEAWSYDKAMDCFATEPAETVKTKKVPRAFVKVEATKEHPAQVETFHEDIQVGTWRTVHYSGGVPQTRVSEILARVTKLHAAVKFAREEANSITVQDRTCGKAVFDYLLARS